MKYLGQRLLCSNIIVWTHTHTYRPGPDQLPYLVPPVKWSVMMQQRNVTTSWKTTQVPQ